MKQLKEKLEKLENTQVRPLTKEEQRKWMEVYLQLGKEDAKKKGIDSFFPISFIGELGELITVMSEHMARPDKGISKFDILDELSDVYGMLHQAMLYYGITMEDIERTSTLKIVAGIKRRGISPDMVLNNMDNPEEAKKLWKSYMESLNVEEQEDT